MTGFQEAYQPTLLTCLEVETRVGSGDTKLSQDRFKETRDLKYEGVTNSGQRHMELGKVTREAKKGYHFGVHEEISNME